MFINWQLRQINLKVVYYGPALSGKTTNLEQIHSHMDPSRRSDLVSLKTSEDRTLYFDFLQLELGKIFGLTPKIQLYTVPGQSYYEASRKLVLRGADGVVFVADSDPKKVRDNLESWQNMKVHLESLNIPINEIPIVVQINKQDLSNALPVQLMTNLLRSHLYKNIPAVACEGQGVIETLKAIIAGVVSNLQKETNIT
jgi:mutual gliding-motility protein MglA